MDDNSGVQGLMGVVGLSGHVGISMGVKVGVIGCVMGIGELISIRLFIGDSELGKYVG